MQLGQDSKRQFKNQICYRRMWKSNSGSKSTTRSLLFTQGRAAKNMIFAGLLCINIACQPICHFLQKSSSNEVMKSLSIQGTQSLLSRLRKTLFKTDSEAKSQLLTAMYKSLPESLFAIFKGGIIIQNDLLKLEKQFGGKTEQNLIQEKKN